MNPNPEEFKRRILEKYPNGVASDGTSYAQMDAADLTQRMISKYPTGVTSDGIAYKDFLQPTQNVEPPKTGVASSALDVAKGFGKAAVEGGVNIVQGLGSLGTGALAAITPGKSWSDLTKQRQESTSGSLMEGLVRGTEEADRQKEILKATNPAQIAGKAAEWAAEALLTGGTSMATKLETKAASQLNKASLHVAGATLRDFGKKVIDNVSNVLTKYKVVGNPTQRTARVAEIEEGFEKVIQSTLEDAKNLKITASKTELIKKLQGLKKGLSGLRDRTALESQIDGAIAEVNRFRENIPLWQLNLFKRSTAKEAFNKVGTKVNDAIEYKIADAAYDLLQNATKKAGLKFNGKQLIDFNEDYQAIVQTKKLLKLAEGKPEIGTLMKIMAYTTGAGVGYTAGGPLAGIVGVTTATQLAKVLGGTAAKSGAASALSWLAEKGTKLGKGIDTLKTLLK